jgi:restriction system protein
MLTENAFVYDGLHGDVLSFQKGLSFIPFDDDEDDPQSTLPGYIIRYDSLGLSASVKGENESTLIPTIQDYINQWIRIWNRDNSSKERLSQTIDLHSDLDELLSSSLLSDHKVDMYSLKSFIPFESTDAWKALQTELDGIKQPSPPSMPIVPPKPNYKEPKIRFSDSLLFRKKSILRSAQQEFNGKMESWNRFCERIEVVKAEKLSFHALEMQTFEQTRLDIHEKIEAQRHNYQADQDRYNEQVDVFEVNYQGRQRDAVERYVGLILERSVYPSVFPVNRKWEYNRNNLTLYLSAEMPHPNALPRDGSQSTGLSINSVPTELYTNQEFNRRYNDVIYKALLRNLHELFSGDHVGAIDAIQVSGWVKTLNKGNGQFENITIATLFCTREEFSKINLSQVDPTLCFRFLKGVSAPELSDLIPIPIPHQFSIRESLDRSTPKVLEPMDGHANLAGLSIRELGKSLIDLFEKEFRLMPGDIKLQQANHDGSMEAWGIDPEPIRGGKFIIQTRKSNQTTTVSAVKELFGSMMHEGAHKGILITTSDFSPEAYEFARNKPLVLLNGSQLLSLFERHGIVARISFREAISLKSWLS